MKIIDLTEFITTKQQANDFSARLANLAGSIYELDTNLEKALQEQLGFQKKEKFMTLLRDNDIPLDSNQEITKFLEGIIKEISSMPEVSITIAIEPDEEILKTIADWFLLNLKKQVLIKTIVNSQLIAGAKVDFQGNHAEFTIEKTMNTLYSANTQEAGRQQAPQKQAIEKQNNNYVESQDIKKTLD